MTFRFFSDEEAKGLDNELMTRLDTARAVAGIPFKITSGLRSCDANKGALGVENSSHLLGKAVDLAVTSNIDRFLIVKGLIDAGFVRIGTYDRHVHCDVDKTKPQNVLWTGISH